jgi:hypothetical protein
VRIGGSLPSGWPLNLIDADKLENCAALNARDDVN